MKKIKDMSPDQSGIEAIMRIEKVALSTSSNGSNYMILHLVDKTGRIEARKWIVTDEDKAAIQPNLFLHMMHGVTNEFRGVLQLKLNDYEVLGEEGLNKFGYDLNDFFISAPVDIKKEYEFLLTTLNGFQNETYKQITLGLLKKYENEFLLYPAAMSIHHNVKGGLFWHSYTLVRNALAIKPNYKYAKIDWELVVAGAILHDIGKVYELQDQSGSDYSLAGKLLGHISLGNVLIEKMADELGLLMLDDKTINPDVILLGHMVLSSHGKHEFGSPVEPLLMEAIIVSTFDNLDARIFRTNEELNKIDDEKWTPKIMSEDGKFFYKHFKK